MKTTACKEDFVSIADSLRIEGYQEGLDKGIQILKMISNGFNSKKISKATGISEEKVKIYAKIYNKRP